MSIKAVNKIKWYSIMKKNLIFTLLFYSGLVNSQEIPNCQLTYKKSNNGIIEYNTPIQILSQNESREVFVQGKCLSKDLNSDLEGCMLNIIFTDITPYTISNDKHLKITFENGLNLNLEPLNKESLSKSIEDFYYTEKLFYIDSKILALLFEHQINKITAFTETDNALVVYPASEGFDDSLIKVTQCIYQIIIRNDQNIKK